MQEGRVGVEPDENERALRRVIAPLPRCAILQLHVVQLAAVPRVKSNNLGIGDDGHLGTSGHLVLQ